MNQNNSQKPVVFTTVMYPTPESNPQSTAQSRVRWPLALETISRAVSRVHIVVLNGGYGDKWIERETEAEVTRNSWIWLPEQDALSDLIRSGNEKNIARFTKNGEGKFFGLWGGRRYAGHVALREFPDAPFYAWSEPEKNIWVNATIDSIIQELKTAGILVGRRNPEKFNQSYPTQQVEVETRAAKIFHEMIIAAARKSIGDQVDSLIGKESLDHWSGPHAFTPETLKDVFLEYRGQGWDSIITILYPALLKRIRIGEFQMMTWNGESWSYPKAQLDLESEDWATYEQLRLTQEATILHATQEEIARYTHQNNN